MWHVLMTLSELAKDHRMVVDAIWLDVEVSKGTSGNAWAHDGTEVRTIG